MEHLFQRPKIKIEDSKVSAAETIGFYLEPPDCSVSLQEFEDLAVARLKLLRILERLSLTAVGAKEVEDWRKKVEHEIAQAGLVEFEHLMKPKERDEFERAQKFDHVSHYILRLAFCRTEELRRWFVNMEVEFFRYKFSCMGDGSLAKDILDTHFQDTIQKFDGDRNEIDKDLLDTYFFVNSADVLKGDIYVVPFTQCLDLVKNRRVYIRGGKAYILHTQLLTIVCSEYRRILSRDLAALSKSMYLIDEDERLSQILTDFDKRHTGCSYTAGKNAAGKDVVTVENLEQTSTTSFPLCMKTLYDHVKKEYHLKHFGRLQLGLFFKGLGLPMEEATRFWRTYFTKKTGVDDTRFDKQYLYNIRHMYGQEGKRADYTPYSCMKVISTSVGPGENHGCPFRHSDATSLRVKFVEAGIPAAGVKEIMELVERHHYQIACQKYFEWTHNKATVDGGVNHPNQYYEESQKVLSGNFKIKTEGTELKVTTVKQYPKKKPDDWEVEVMNSEDILKALEDPDLEEVEPMDVAEEAS